MKLLLILAVCSGLMTAPSSSISQNAFVDTNSASASTKTGNGAPLAVLSVRKQMTDAERLHWLETNGEVPTDADLTDWSLAQKTSWWGKPLDAKKFWRGRVIWLDLSARQQAQRHGRSFAPIPYEHPNLPHHKDTNDLPVDVGSLDAPDIHFRWNAPERAFWSVFVFNHPMPPEDITREQFQVATRTINGKQPKATDELSKAVEQTIKHQAIQMGYPSEAFSSGALFWAYVLNERTQYEQLQGPDDPKKDARIRLFLSGLKVDSRFVTEPLNDEQKQSAEEWKITYLNRLKQENADPSYINAYLKAWNLPITALNTNSEK